MGSAVIHRRKTSYHSPQDGSSNGEMVRRKFTKLMIEIHRQGNKIVLYM